ncbi:hypothetical protein [Massilia sp. 9096]|uniref:hypothetical protein n=1 Tax=Massilia sp. 9096 TaxID=1500894 RepID=UPI00055DF0E9|nr:hypothetical protein [Massilia sp. 9096]
MSAPPVVVEAETADIAIGTQGIERLTTGLARRPRPVLLLFFVSLGLLLPMLIWGLPSTGDDSASHLRWQYFYSRQMWDSDPFPRWIRDLADGFGSPAFFIYPPLPHFVAALLAPASDGIAWLHRRLAIAITLACFVGAVGAFTWLKQVTRERNTALIGAMVYTLAPYHLFVDTYFRTAYAELWGLAWAPFAFAGLHLLASRRRAGVALTILGVSGLLLSHAPSALILVPTALVYAGLLALPARRWDVLAWAGAAACSAVLIAGLYLATALTQQKYIHTSELYTGYYNFYNWLMFAPNPVSKRAFDMSGLLQATLTFVLASAPLSAPGRRDDARATWRRLAVATVIGTVLLSFMMTRFSAPIWTLLPFAQKIQFPWRLQTAQTLLLALSSVLFLRALRPRSPWRDILPLLALAAINIAMFQHAPSRFGMPGLADTHETPEYTLGDTIGNAGRFAGGARLALGAGAGGGARSASLDLLRWEPRSIVFRIDAAAPTEVLAKQFNYTGWTCRAAGDPAGTAASCRMLSTGSGDLVRVQVAPGRHDIELAMPETLQERAGKLVSVVGLVLAAAAIFAAGRRRRTSAP